MARGRKSARGFTMTEMLIAVGIMVVLFAVAAPNVIAARRSLRMMELDEKAHQIYNAVQYNASALQSAGKLYRLTTPDTRKIADEPSDYTGTNWDKTALYWFEDENSVDNTILTNLFYSTDTNPITASGGSGNAIGNNSVSTTTPAHSTVNGSHFLVEMSPSTGEVYAVYYWEGDISADVLTEGKTADYAKMSPLRTRAQRAPKMLGYYGGGQVSNGINHDGIVKFDDLHFDLINSEELYVSIKSTDFEKPNFDPRKMQIKVTVTSLGFGDTRQSTSAEEDTNHQIIFTINPAETGFQTGDGEVDLILDSMRTDNAGTRMSFANIISKKAKLGDGVEMERSAITTDWTGTHADANYDWDNPYNGFGAYLSARNIRVRVEVSYNGQTYNSSTNPGNADGEGGLNAQDANTSFAAITTDQDRATSERQTKTAEITCLRHLDNLHGEYYNLKNDYWEDNSLSHILITGGDEIASQYTSSDALMLSPSNGMPGIDFDGTHWTPQSVSIASRKDARKVTTGDGSTLATVNYNPLSYDNEKLVQKENPYFTPLSFAADEFHSPNQNVPPLIEAAKLPASLSSDASNAPGYYALKNFNIGNGGDETGFVVDLASNSTAVNMQNLYMLDPLVKGGDKTGVFTSKISNTNGSHLVGCHAYVTRRVQAADGSLRLDMSRGVEGTSNVGGLTGYANGPADTIKDCSATLNVTGAGANVSNVGGLVGYCVTPITNCSYGLDGEAVELASYPAVAVDAPNNSVSEVHVGGIVGYLSMSSANGKVEGCKVLAVIVSPKGKMAGGVIGYMDGSGVVTGCTYGLDAEGKAPTNREAIAIKCNDQVGGIVGTVKTGGIKDCAVVADISGDDNIGGIVGYFKGQGAASGCTFGIVTDDSRNSAPAYADELCTVTGKSGRVGGFAGHINNDGSGGVQDVRVMANVSGGSYVGGFVGHVEKVSSIKGCWVRGVPSATNPLVATVTCGKANPTSDDGNYAGGFIGRNESPYGQVSNCYAAVDVVPADDLPSGRAVNYGGFVGWNTAPISNCYASGDVTGGLNVGGFAGQTSGSEIKSCYTTSDVRGSDVVGGFVGTADNAINSCTSYGIVLTKDGDTPTSGAFGGFAGKFGSGDGNTYLKLTGYNDTLAANGVTAASYAQLATQQHVGHPYSAALYDGGTAKPFPFATVTKDKEHYGDWPGATVTVVWKRGNDELARGEGMVGMAVAYPGNENPNYTSDDGRTVYDFTGWQTEDGQTFGKDSKVTIADANGDGTCEIAATYEAKSAVTVIWYGWDGKELESQSGVVLGSTVSYPADGKNPDQIWSENGHVWRRDLTGWKNLEDGTVYTGANVPVQAIDTNNDGVCQIQVDYTGAQTVLNTPTPDDILAIINEKGESNLLLNVRWPASESVGQYGDWNYAKNYFVKAFRSDSTLKGFEGWRFEDGVLSGQINDALKNAGYSMDDFDWSIQIQADTIISSNNPDKRPAGYETDGKSSSSSHSNRYLIYVGQKNRNATESRQVYVLDVGRLNAGENAYCILNLQTESYNNGSDNTNDDYLRYSLKDGRDWQATLSGAGTVDFTK